MVFQCEFGGRRQHWQAAFEFLVVMFVLLRSHTVASGCNTPTVAAETAADTQESQPQQLSQREGD